jgi:effector-binding domain-containing protein
MLDTPQITHSPAQITATIHVRIPRSEIKTVLEPAIREVYAAVLAQGLAPTGPWFTYHPKIEPEVFDFDACVPVDRPIVATGRVKPGELRAAKVARTIYHGPYEGLAEAWPDFNAWIEASGLTPATDRWARFLVGPESTSDPSEWRTELNRPLIG